KTTVPATKSQPATVTAAPGQRSCAAATATRADTDPRPKKSWSARIPAPTSARGGGLPRADEGAHHLSVHMARDRVGVEARPREKLAGVLQPVDARRLELDRLEPDARERCAVLGLVEGPRHA